MAHFFTEVGGTIFSMTGREADTHVSRLADAIAWPVLASVVYLLAAEVAFSVGTLSDKIFAPFWPPNVVLFCALLLAPYSRWWIFILAAFPAHVLAEMKVGMPLDQMVVAFVTNCLIAVLNALCTRKLLAGQVGLASFQHALLYVVSTGAINPAVVAVAGAAVRILGGGAVSNYWTYWAEWFAANALAQLAFGPMVLAFITNAEGRLVWRNRRSLAEALLLVIGLSGACFLAFRTPVDAAFLPALLYAPLPFLVWAAVRFGVVGSSGAILTVTVLCIWAALRGGTSFSANDPESNVLGLQLFLMGLSIPTLLLGASVEAMRHAERKAAELTRTVLALHDEDRRRTALALHDGVCQDLVAASLLANRLKEVIPARRPATIEEVQKKLQSSIGGLREASYLLHPPMLEEAGLEAAVRSFVHTFTRRTGVEVDVDIASTFGRLPRDTEIVLFRFVQEALANVSQHSGRTTARVKASFAETSESRRVVVLTVEDRGAGTAERARVPHLLRKMTPIAIKHDSSLASVRARLSRIGGELQIDSIAGRTILRAVVRIPNTHVSVGAAITA